MNVKGVRARERCFSLCFGVFSLLLSFFVSVIIIAAVAAIFFPQLASNSVFVCVCVVETETIFNARCIEMMKNMRFTQSIFNYKCSITVYSVQH